MNIHMQYIVLRDGDYIRTIKRTPLIAMRTTVHSDTDDIIVELGSNVLPEDIETLLSLRCPRRPSYYNEPEEYADTLKLFGSNPPTIVPRLNIVRIPEEHIGRFYVPEDTDRLITHSCPGLTGLSGNVLGVNHMTLCNTGIIKFIAPDSVTTLDMSDNHQLTSVSGKNIKRLFLNNTGIVRLTASDSVTYLNMSNNSKLTHVAGRYIKELYLASTAIIRFNVPDNVTFLDMSNNSQLIKINNIDGLETLILWETDATTFTGEPLDTRIQGLKSIARNTYD